MSDPESALVEWANVTSDRDSRVRRAIAVGITKNRIHTITGISRATIDRILKENAMHTYRGYSIVEHHGTYPGGEDRPAHFHTQFVRDGDKALIPSDCDGGFATVEEAQADIDSIPRAD